MAMAKVSPDRVITEYVNKAFIAVDLPRTNNPRTQQMLSDLLIANAMASLGTARKKAITDELKDIHQEKLAKAVTNEKLELEFVEPFTLTAKVASPRSSFDKDAFIKAVAEEYDLPMSELIALSKRMVKSSTAPIAFEVSVNKAL